MNILERCCSSVRWFAILVLALTANAGWSAVSAQWAEPTPSVNENAGPAVVHLMLTGASATPVTVTWQSNQESALPGLDYTGGSGSVTFQPGETSKALSFAIVNDIYNAGNRAFGLQITNIQGANWGSPTYVHLTIVEDDTSGPPRQPAPLSWAASPTTVSRSGGATAFTLNLGWVWTSPVTVTWKTNNESAVAGTDFTAANGTVVFAVGETSKTVSVTMLPRPGVVDTVMGLQITGVTGGNWGNPNYVHITLSNTVPTVATPVLSPAAGTFTAPVSLTASSTTSGATLRYTVDGSDPVEGSPVLPSPLIISATTTVSVRAFASGMTASAVARGTYTIVQATVATPVITPATGTYAAVQTATATTSTAGATLRYRTDGAVPTEADPAVPAGGVAIGQSLTLTVRGFLSGWTPSATATTVYTLQVPSPTISPTTTPASTSFAATVSIPAGAQVFYTLDGSVPTATSTPYVSPVTIDRSLTMRAIAVRSGWQSSAVTNATWTFQTATPTVSPTAGTYAETQSVTLATATVGGTIRYTTDGSDPATSGTAQTATGAITIDHSLTLAAVITRDGWTTSAPLTAAYVLQVQPVTADLAAGAYVGPQAVTLSCPTAGAVIHYTLDGSVPTAASAVATGAIALPGSSTLRAIALRSGWSSSPVFSAAYTLQVAPLAIVPAGGAFTAPVTATVATPAGVTVRYTVDGTAPAAASSILPADGLVVDQGLTLTVAGFAAGWTTSQATAAAFTFTAATPTADLAAGTFTAEQDVTLATTTAGGVIRYTVDGSDPISSPTAQTASGAIHLDHSLTLTAVTMRAGWSTSAPLAIAYVFTVPAPVIPPSTTTAVAPFAATVTVPAGAQAYYTLEGSAPTAASTLYSGPIAIDHDLTLSVIAVRAGWTSSAVQVATYAIIPPNQTPTVAAPAAAAPSPVTGTTATCTVLGADDGGEAALTYAWVADAGPAPVTFSASGSHAAATTVATFTAPGSYHVVATISDAQGLTATSAVTVTVVATPSVVVMAPTSFLVNATASQTVTAAVTDQFGQPLVTPVAWSATGGTITEAGVYTAGSVGGSFLVTGTAGSATGQSVALINPAPVITSTTATPATIDAGHATSLIVAVTDADAEGNADTAQLTYQWTQLAGPTAIVDGATTLTATAMIATAGTARFRVAVTDPQGAITLGTVDVVVRSTSPPLVTIPATDQRSPLVVGARFQSSAWASSATYREQYAAGTDAGRVWDVDTASALHLVRISGPEVAALAVGGSATLTVRGKPGYPISILCPQGINAGNATKVQTVVADAAGEAQLTISASTKGTGVVLIACPGCRNLLRIPTIVR